MEKESNANGDNITVSGFKVVAIGNVTLSYQNYYEQTAKISVRGDDPFTLYPSWSVALGFDKVYPGNVTSVLVKIWADTGIVSSVSPMKFDDQAAVPSDTATQASASQMSMPATILLVISVISLSSTSAYLYSSKLRLSRSKLPWRLNLSTRKTAVLCLAAIAIGGFVIVPIAQASDMRAALYISTVQYSEYDWADIYYARAAENYIQMLYSQYAGVDTIYYPYGFWGANLISDIMYDETSYSTVAVFAYGNGYYPTFIGGNEYDYINYWDISSATNGYYAHHFVWQWTCTLAENQDFARAWTQNWGYMSTDGFNYPDYTGYAYAGFQGEAPFIGAEVQAYLYYTQPLYMWVEWVYYYAISGYNFHDALDLASWNYLGNSYVNTVAYDSIYSTYTYYPLYPYWFQGGMMVYGDSTIHIFP